MRGDLLPRSNIERPTFPDTLNLGPLPLILIEDDHADRLWKGDPILGWEGDNRLAMYLAPPAPRSDPRWVVVRYCENRDLQIVRSCHAGPFTAMQAVGELITGLMESDGRRGVNLGEVVNTAATKRQAEVDASLESWVEAEGAPRAAKAIQTALG